MFDFFDIYASYRSSKGDDINVQLSPDNMTIDSTWGLKWSKRFTYDDSGLTSSLTVLFNKKSDFDYSNYEAKNVYLTRFIKSRVENKEKGLSSASASAVTSSSGKEYYSNKVTGPELENFLNYMERDPLILSIKTQ